MSAFDWKIGSVAHFVGLGNYTALVKNQRFLEAIVHTFYFTALAVVFPLLLGLAAALIFHRSFPAAGPCGSTKDTSTPVGLASTL